jgi:hypothetical protein
MRRLLRRDRISGKSLIVTLPPFISTDSTWFTQQSSAWLSICVTVQCPSLIRKDSFSPKVIAYHGSYDVVTDGEQLLFSRWSRYSTRYEIGWRQVCSYLTARLYVTGSLYPTSYAGRRFWGNRPRRNTHTTTSGIVQGLVMFGLNI